VLRKAYLVTIFVLLGFLIVKNLMEGRLLVVAAFAALAAGQLVFLYWWRQGARETELTAVVPDPRTVRPIPRLTASEQSSAPTEVWDAQLLDEHAKVVWSCKHGHATKELAEMCGQNRILLVPWTGPPQAPPSE
jgi:hypothetical protein